MEQHAYCSECCAIFYSFFCSQWRVADESCVISIYWNLVAPSTQLTPSSAEFGDLNLVLPTVVSLIQWCRGDLLQLWYVSLRISVAISWCDFSYPQRWNMRSMYFPINILVLLQLLCFWCIPQMQHVWKSDMFTTSVVYVTLVYWMETAHCATSPCYGYT